MKTPASDVARGMARYRHLAAVASFVLTFASGNAAAVSVPNTPMQTVAEFPAPNVRFILDDSGSMTWAAMPADIANHSDLQDTISDKSSVNNTIYYDPNRTYLPWIKADGSRYTTGLSYTSAHSNASHASGSTNLSNAVQTYFVLKDGATDTTSNASYWRYQIRTVSGELRVVRSEWLAAGSGTSTNLISVNGISGNAGNWTNNGGTGNTAPAEVKSGTPAKFTLADGISRLTVTISGNNGDADLYLRSGALPTTSTYTCRPYTDSSNEVCTIDNPAAGDWYVGIRAFTNFNGLSLTVTTEISSTGLSGAGCSTSTRGSDWRNCTFARPAGRSDTEEMANFATWYSYHRTRMKTAKAGASEAFYGLTERARVGFDTINLNTDDFPMDIPVSTDGGLFRGSNKSDWFDRLFAAEGDNGTPLHQALQRAGEYFLDTSSTGPWGPESGANQVSCRQNFSILTTDGIWNTKGTFTSVGDTDNSAEPTHTLAAGSSAIMVNNTPYLGYRVENPYSDHFSGRTTTQADTLADVAMHYWKTDLSTLPNNVPASSGDPAFWQHMVTFGVSIGQKGSLSPTDSVLNNIRLGTTRWPDPWSNDYNNWGGNQTSARIDDLWHASVNGHGKFVVASNSSDFQRSLQNAFEVIAQREGTASNVTANSTTFIDQTRIYQASYTSRVWTGELKAFSVSSSGIGAQQWAASTGIPAVASRHVYTWDGTAGTNFPTAAQTTALNASTRALSPVSGADNAAYIKGDRSREGEGTGRGLRTRSSLLGDIVQSSPFYVKDNETIFVGANDGMLHAINASNGTERFAYVPAGINLTDLASLSDPFYSHKYFVDGPVVVSDRSQTPGHNYLVGTLGRGGKGVFAMDVTTPDSFNPATHALWEINSGSDLGFVLGEPLLATLNDGSQTKVAIFGNGINSSNGHAVLYVVNLSSGVLIQRIDTGVGGDNGLFAPRGADIDGNGTVDYVYAGDMRGNLWKFDFRTATRSVDFGGDPMFTAASGQAFTGGLALAKDPATSKIWVFGGTGRFIASGDLSDNTVQSFYGLRDDASSTLARGDLQQTDITLVGTQDGKPVRAFTGHGPLDSSKNGWFIDFDDPSPGERIITRPLVRQSVVVFSSLIPPTSNTCNAAGGGFVNALDAFTGTSTTDPFFVGSSGGMKVTVTDGDGNSHEVSVGSVDVGVGQPTQPVLIDQLLVVGGTSESGATRGTQATSGSGGTPRRSAWREILTQ